jgi:enterochelin esterase family protein
LNGKSASLRLLWIACGTEDDLITPNRNFIAWLKTKDVPVTAIETPGMHNWMVWRNNLVRFAPLLFQK